MVHIKRGGPQLLNELSCNSPTDLHMTELYLVVLGVGAGATCTYQGEASSSFILCADGSPVLMLDVVRGRALLQTRATNSSSHHSQPAAAAATHPLCNTHAMRVMTAGPGVCLSSLEDCGQPAAAHLRLPQPHRPRRCAICLCLSAAGNGCRCGGGGPLPCTKPSPPCNTPPPILLSDCACHFATIR